ncbi:hypothetical protein EMIHUDRAFT_447139, partial [Emiliania huxleyi CCMP1516]|uniref:Uncharacterized protein n=2 Tax=Emiliania huxleyi TaxID=2903 RepID=A0A0D3K3G9_EMIH1
AASPRAAATWRRPSDSLHDLPLDPPPRITAVSSYPRYAAGGALRLPQRHPRAVCGKRRGRRHRAGKARGPPRGQPPRGRASGLVALEPAGDLVRVPRLRPAHPDPRPDRPRAPAGRGATPPRLRVLLRLAAARPAAQGLLLRRCFLDARAAELARGVVLGSGLAPPRQRRRPTAREL